jgi:hypothetical protein
MSAFDPKRTFQLLAATHPGNFTIFTAIRRALWSTLGNFNFVAA